MRLASWNRHIALAGGLLAALLAATPSLAAGSYQPDGWIRWQSFRYDDGGEFSDRYPWSGKDVYNTTGRHQTEYVDLGIEKGTYQVFRVRIENDGASPDRFRVAGTGTGHWDVKYFRRTTDITSAVVAGTYQTRLLRHGETAGFRIEVNVDPDVADRTRLVTISSVGNPNQTDVVRLKGSFNLCRC